LVTRPLVLGEAAEQLVLNFETSGGGSVRVGLETADGKPIPGHELASCLPLTGNSIRRTVTWKAGADISPLKGSVVRLRFQLKNADVYSLQFQPRVH
jgi:hypothetical protein